MIVLPEGTVPAYVLGRRPLREKAVLRAAADLAEIARTYRATLVYGGVKIVEDRVYNAAIVIGPDGEELGFSAKRFLWHFDRHWFAPGRELCPIETPAGRLGLLVCADGRIPTICAALVELGAELLVMPTAWVTSGRDPGALENVQADLMVNVRARENGVPLVAANKAGVELEAVAYCGKSTIVAADGTTRARADERSECVLYDELPLQRPDIPRCAAAGDVTDVKFSRSPAPSALRRRVAFTLERDTPRLAAFREFAADADADVLVALDSGEAGVDSTHAERSNPESTQSSPLPLVRIGEVHGHPRTVFIAGICAVVADDRVVHDPRGLVGARLSGIDLIVWQTRDATQWQVQFARTRAAELRAYVLVADVSRARSFAVDPDGAVVSGTFDGYRLASFLYDRARTTATTVAPHTDVADGLRAAERMRAEGLISARAD